MTATNESLTSWFILFLLLLLLLLLLFIRLPFVTILLAVLATCPEPFCDMFVCLRIYGAFREVYFVDLGMFLMFVSKFVVC